MPTVTGIFNTGNFVTDQAKKSFASMLTRLMPNGSAPLFALTSKLQDRTAVAVEHGFFTKTMIFPSFALTATITSGDTTFPVVSSASLVPGQLLRLEQTGEIVIVNTIVSSTSITVGRGIGTVAAAGITFGSTNPNAYQVGNAYEESSVRPQALSITPVRITNLTQIFRNTWALSGSSRATQIIAGDTNVAESRQDCAAFHAADIEKAIFFSQKSSGTRNGQPFRTMDGLINIVGNIAYYPPSFSTPNVYAAGSTTTYAQLISYLDPTFNQNTDPRIGNQRLLFVGGTAFNVINGIGRLSGVYEIVAGATDFGLQFTTFKIPRGTFTMIEHPLFNTNAYWSKMAVAVDPSTFSLAYLGDRKTQAMDFNQNGTPVDNGIDAVGGSLLTELTTEIRNPPANAIITNLTAAA